MKGWILKLSAFAVLIALGACSNQGTEDAQFQLLTHRQTGLDFDNTLEPTSAFNVFNYMYFFNGGGVAAGDFNQDGLPDLYFTANMGSNKLFLNKGGMKFEDITQKAGVGGEGGWKTGASIVDINQDGLLDIYVSQMGDYNTIKGKNQLFICKEIQEGVPVFEEQAADFGLDLVVFGTQSTFFDYDLDGDLDLYLLNHSLHANGTFGQRKVFAENHPKAGDRLFRNDNGQFTDVTEEAGINSTAIGYGLGVVTGDVNLDGWPDIYVGNDFHENDYLYINQKDGTFKEDLTNQIRHTSRFTMGVDMADINNDAYPEILSLDMLPEDPFILKSSLAEDSYKLFHFKLKYGYNHQYSRNNLQLNNGDGSFSEIGLFAGVEATDWSWATLIQDFDHDGLKDLFISNGIPRRMNDIDYVNFRADNEIRYKQQMDVLEEDDLVVVEKMPKIKLKNKYYQNAGGLRFKDQTDQIHQNEPSYSNGAIYADLDADGDLDLVVNNLEDKPFVYQNLLMEGEERADRSYVSLQLEGPLGNLQGIGSRLLVEKTNGDRLYYEYYPVRGYQSSSLVPFHVPLGDPSAIESITLVWPNNRYQEISGAFINQTKTIPYTDGLPIFNWDAFARQEEANYAVQEDTTSGMDFIHKENYYNDFDREGLIPWMITAQGPASAVGDLNGDGLDDVFFGSSKSQKAALFYQKQNGKFEQVDISNFGGNTITEEVDAEVVDLDNDGLNDLIIATGGNEFWLEEPARRQRIHWNEGNGTWTADDQVFGDFFLTSSSVVVFDLDGDGLKDVFFGGRAVPWEYGNKPGSALFLNLGNRKFENVTEKLAPELADLGMVRNASGADLDQDGDEDILLAMDWGPVIALLNKEGGLAQQVLWEEHGWWNAVQAGDFDQDGDLDLIALGIGENSKLRPTLEEPVQLYVNDYDGNGKTEQVLTYFKEGKEYPFATYAELTTQIPDLKKKYLFSKDLARAELSDIFGAEKLRSAFHLRVDEARHILLENLGDLTYRKQVLPDLLQFSFLKATAQLDIDQDGKEELVVGGNFYRNNIEMGRYDANAGNIIQFSDKLEPTISSFGNIRLDGVVKHIKKVTVKGELHLLVVFNDKPSQLFKVGPKGKLLTMNK